MDWTELRLFVKAILLFISFMLAALATLYALSASVSPDQCRARWQDSGYHVRWTQDGVCQVQQGDVWIPESAIQIQPR